MTTPTPASVTTARVVAAAQAVFAAGCAVLCVTYAAVSTVADRRAAGSGDANELAGLGEILGTVGALAALTAAAVVAVPALLLRRRRGARVALIAGEAGSGLVLVAGLTTVAGDASVGTALAGAYAATAAAVVVALLSEPARVWSMTVPGGRYSHRARTSVAGC